MPDTAVVDAYDALTNDRPPPGKRAEEALAELKNAAPSSTGTGRYIFGND